MEESDLSVLEINGLDIILNERRKTCLSEKTTIFNGKMYTFLFSIILTGQYQVFAFKRAFVRRYYKISLAKIVYLLFGVGFSYNGDACKHIHCNKY